jgi:hypothetical protein
MEEDDRPFTMPCEFLRGASSSLCNFPPQRFHADSPFTLHSVQDDKSIRYVAEENIDPQPGDEVVPEDFPMEIGMWFKRWDDIQKVFVSNIKDEYPDD